MRVTRPSRLALLGVLVLAALGTARSARAQTPLAQLLGAPGDLVGYALAGAGDVDLDGVPDLLVGSPRAVTSVGGPDGVVELRSGRHLATGVGTAVLRTWQGAPNVSLQRSRFGHAVDGGSDVDRDGVPDVVVGSPGDDLGGIDGGTVTVFSGATGGVLARFDRPAHQAFGSAVAFAGDVNGDGWIDVLAGAPVNDSTFGTAYGRVHVFSGEWIASTAAGQAPATPMELFARDGDWNHDDYGSSVAPLGDLDGDGRGDFAVGAKRGGPNAGGYVHVVLGGSALPSVTIPGGSFADYFGFAIAAAGDVDGDGLHELAVGAWGEDDGSGANTSHGAVELVSGAWMRASALGVPPAGPRAVWTRLGAATWDFLGTAVAAVGDLDGDGASEVAAAATQGSYGPPLGTGYVDVFSGRSGARLFTLRGTYVEGLFGLGIAGVGDLDQDGRPDLAVGAPRDAAAGADAGAVAILRGFPSIGTAVCASAATPNSSGLVARVTARGSASRAAEAAFVELAGAPPARLAVLFRGTDPTQVPFGNGYRCASGGLARVHSGLASASGGLVAPLDLALVPPGGTVVVQAWFDDAPGGGAGFNLSDAALVVPLP